MMDNGMNSPLFKKSFLLTISLTVIFIILGFFLSFLMIREQRNKFWSESPRFIAHLIDGAAPGQLLKTLQNFQKWWPQLELVLLNEDGATVFREQERFAGRGHGAAEKLPRGPFQYLKWGQGGLVRLSGTPPRYLYVEFHRDRNFRRRVLLTAFFTVLVFVIMGIFISFLILFYTLRKKAVLADQVISEIQRGNLKARFPITRMDEYGKAMLRFNRMADKIEELVNQIKAQDQARLNFLQELAHDMRTPVSSLKGLLETVHERGELLGTEMKGRFMNLATKEVEYIENLLEDLLFLGQLHTARLRKLTSDRVSLREIIDDEIENRRSLCTPGERTIRFQRDFPEGPLHIQGNTFLLRRLIKNALNNAAAYARSLIGVQIRESGEGLLEIVVLDDGPGFSADAMRTFGVRRYDREIVAVPSEKLSLGLGSVIMKEIVETHHGRVKARNRSDPEGHVLGAEVSFRLPKTNQEGQHLH